MRELELILTLAVVFTILVWFHELGHFLFAKLFKMRVEEFSIGFGKPKIRVYHDGETEYSVRPLPIGGFVRIAGMEIEDAAERRLTDISLGKKTDSADKQDTHDNGMETTNVSTLQQEAAEVSGVEKDGFNSRPIFQRFLVILAGPVFSLLLGWLTFCLIGVTIGLPSGPPTTRILGLSEGMPAQKAGLKPGDTIVAINGDAVPDGEKMISRISAAPGQPLLFTVKNAGSETTREVSITPQEVDAGGKKIGRIGVTPASSGSKRVGLGQSITLGTAMTVGFYEQLANIFIQGKVRENIGGPIGIVKVTQEATNIGGPAKPMLLAQLSLSLAFFNLLPVPILDGGHLLLMMIEAVRRRKLTAIQMERVFTAGAALLLMLFLYVMFNDISKLFTRG